MPEPARGVCSYRRVGVNRYNFLLESLQDLDNRWAACPSNPDSGQRRRLPGLSGGRGAAYIHADGHGLVHNKQSWRCCRARGLPAARIPRSSLVVALAQPPPAAMQSSDDKRPETEAGPGPSRASP